MVRWRVNSKSTHMVIVQPARKDSGAVPANGTKVMTEDGHEITGITSISLHAEVGDVWRATIECTPHVSEPMIVRAVMQSTLRLNWWQRLCFKVSGLRIPVETTSIADDSRRYKRFP